MGGRRKWAFRDKKKASFLVYFGFLHSKYRLIYRLYPPLLGDQIMLALA